ncbi:MAG: heavy metal translocating P-type ATPase [Chromatiales bacterium]|nr:heavy metal translocating P-type ATPase [Chromatiales bacterium]
MSAVQTPCYHCGQTIPNGVNEATEVLGERRRFCCTGCKSVAKAIVDAGLDDYYRHRQGWSGRPDDSDGRDILRKLDLYDRPDIQKGFVRGSEHAREAHLILENIRCAACLWVNERHLRGLDGVLDVEIDYATERARVVWDPRRIALSRILEAIAAIGYHAHPYDPAHREQLLADARRRDGQRLLFAGVTGMPVMQMALATYLMGGPGADGSLPLWQAVGRWIGLLIVLAILSYSAQDFFVGAWRDLRNRRLGMDVPIVLGLLTALFGSLAGTISQSGEVYYDSIAMFVFFLLVARHIEMRGRRTAAAALDRMAKVIPATAQRLQPDDSEETVAVVDLHPGDRLRIRPGETVPLDGTIESGSSGFDESLLTGESLPVERGEGDAVVGGSCNRDQSIVMVVTHDRADSTESRIRQLLDSGLRHRPRYAVLAERAATFFVGAILILASLTALYWWQMDPAQALPNTLAVLIVTCPCALALATPVTLALAAGRFSEMGVVPARMDAIETLAKAPVVALDKTGTLTEGRPRLVETVPLSDLPAEQILGVVHALESLSEHPLAQAFRQMLVTVAYRPEDWQNHPGQGVSANIEGRHWRLGRLDFALAGNGGPLAETVAALNKQGHLVQTLSRDGVAVALLVLADGIRPGAGQLSAGLRAQGVKHIEVLSGDTDTSVRRVCAALGVDGAQGNLTPADKLAWIRSRQQRGEQVWMVGDGINDAPTLAAADCSLSMQGGADLARIHSDFLFLGQDMSLLVRARQLARRTRNTIRQNLLWAAAYNLLAVPAAAAGLIPPWGAAIGMSLSSLLVVGNAWRMYRSTAP